MSHTISVLPLERKHIPVVVPLLRTHLEMWGFPTHVSNEQLAERLMQSVADLGGLYTKDRRWAHWVAVKNGRVLGASLTYAVDPPASKDVPHEALDGHIVWFLFDPKFPDVADALLEHAEHWLGSDRENVAAFELANCLGWCAGVPPAWHHVTRALVEHGFQPTSSLDIMWGEVKALAPSHVGVDRPVIRIDREDNGPRMKLNARIEQQHVGYLEVAPMQPDDLMLPWKDAWYIEFVEVDEAYRRRGVAKQLFQALVEQLHKRRVTRLVGYTDSPAAKSLNTLIGMDHTIVQRYFVKQVE